MGFRTISSHARHAAGRDWPAAAGMRWSPPTWQARFGWEAGGGTGFGGNWEFLLAHGINRWWFCLLEFS